MVSTTIVVERKEEGHVYKVQRPIYYISEVLTDSKIRYPHIQKLLYAFLITFCKLRHYFKSHKITIITDFPLGEILRNKDATGRISKWEVELGALNIDFSPWKAITPQALADFVAEWTEIQQPALDTFLDHWKMYFDGSVKLGRAGAGVLFISLEGKQLKYVLGILWQATNNEAEYEALIHGLRVVTSLGIKRLLVYGDSVVVINQVNKDWDCIKNNIDTYCAEVRKLEKNFQGLEILHVLRDSNIAADVLAKLGLDRVKVPPGVFIEELPSPSIKQPDEITPEPPAPTT
jgi:ribonuclease HI